MSILFTDKRNLIVDIIAPAWSCEASVFPKAKKILNAWGFEVKYPKKIFGKDYICSNTKLNRLSHLKDAIYNSKSSIIWCVRGGYGSNHLVHEMINWPKPKSKKLIIGFSDITSLQSFANSKWAWPAIHGPLLDRLAKNEIKSKDLSILKSLLYGGTAKYLSSGFNGFNASSQNLAKSRNELEGEIIGGNLSVIQSMIGTPYQPKFKNKILFLEDWGERGYKVDKMLYQIRHSGMLREVKAIILGEFLGGKESNGKSKVNQVLRHHANELQIPIFNKFKLGHGKNQFPLVFGIKSQVLYNQKTKKFYLSLKV